MVPICQDKSPLQINSLWADFSKQMGIICFGQTTRADQERGNRLPAAARLSGGTSISKQCEGLEMLLSFAFKQSWTRNRGTLSLGFL